MTKGSRADAGTFALALRDAAMRTEGVVLAEVFVRVARSRRVQWIHNEGSLHHRAEESGVALRVWDAQGREGFVHADDIEGRVGDSLLDQAVWLMTRSSVPARGLIPRLPSPLDQGPSAGFDHDQEERDEDHDAVERETEWLRRAEDSAAGQRDRAPGVRLREAWLEEGWGRTWITNSRGLEVSFPFRLEAAGVDVGTGRSTVRYAVPAAPDMALRPDVLILGALDEAPVHDASDPPPEGETTVVLSPRAVAVWLRAVMRILNRDYESPAGDGRDPRQLLRSGFHIVEDVGMADGPVSFDGEGRMVRFRKYVSDGRISHPITSSLDQVRVDELPGPMRRDSYRDRPSPGPMALAIPADGDRRTPLIEDLDRGLLVTALTPRGTGGGTFLAEARGFWIDRGRAPRPVPPTLVQLGHECGLGQVVARGNDPEPGPPGMPIRTPSLMFEKAALTPL